MSRKTTCIPLSGLVLVASLCLVAGYLSGQTSTSAYGPAEGVIVGDEIYDNEVAANFAKRARKYDSPPNLRERNLAMAVQYYSAAIDAQPGAKINAALANRIAQIYAFTTEPGGNWKNDRMKALQWWRRCRDMVSQDQLLWAECHIPMGAFISSDAESALVAYEPVLSMDPDTLRLPDWKVWPDADTERGRRQLESEMANLRKRVEGVRRLAVRKVLRVCKRKEPEAAVATLYKLIEDYPDSPVAHEAAKLIRQELRLSASDPLPPPPEVTVDDQPDNNGDPTQPAPRETTEPDMQSPRDVLDTAEPPVPAPKPAPDASPAADAPPRPFNLTLPAVVLAGVAALAAVAILLWRRSRGTPHR